MKASDLEDVLRSKQDRVVDTGPVWLSAALISEADHDPSAPEGSLANPRRKPKDPSSFEGRLSETFEAEFAIDGFVYTREVGGDKWVRHMRTSDRLTPAQIGERAPVCPSCKEPLIARMPHRRFMENDNYQECINGHVWELRDVLAVDLAP